MNFIFHSDYHQDGTIHHQWELSIWFSIARHLGCSRHENKLPTQTTEWKCEDRSGKAKLHDEFVVYTALKKVMQADYSSQTVPRLLDESAKKRRLLLDDELMSYSSCENGVSRQLVPRIIRMPRLTCISSDDWKRTSSRPMIPWTYHPNEASIQNRTFATNICVYSVTLSEDDHRNQVYKWPIR